MKIEAKLKQHYTIFFSIVFPDYKILFIYTFNELKIFYFHYHKTSPLYMLYVQYFDIRYIEKLFRGLLLFRC